MHQMLLQTNNVGSGYHLAFSNNPINAKVIIAIQFYVQIIQKLIILYHMMNVKHGILIAHLNLEMLVIVKIYVHIIKLKMNVITYNRQVIVNGMLLFVRKRYAVA